MEHPSLLGEKVELLRKKLESEVLVGQMAWVGGSQSEDETVKVKLFRQASVAFAKAGDAVVELLPLVDQSEKEYFNVLNHDLRVESGDLSLQIGEFYLAAVSYKKVSNISASIAETKGEDQEKVLWLERCYQERIKSAEYAIRVNDLKHAAVALGLAAKVAQMIPNINSLESQYRWDKKAYVANQKAGKLWLELDEPERAETSLRFASVIMSRLI